MKSLAVLASLVLVVPLASAQVCNPICATQPAQCCLGPQPPAPFMAFESDSRTSGIFRGLVTSQTQCVVDTDVDDTTPVRMPLSGIPVSANLPGGGTLSFLIQQLVERWDTVGGTLGGGFCFSLRALGFHTPSGPFTVHDGCGDHLISIEGPTFFCSTPAARFICFKEKNLNGNTLPNPPGFDRPEDVCIAF